MHVKGKWRLDSAKAEGLTFGASTATDSLTPISGMHNRDRGKSFFKQMAGAQRVMFEVETVGDWHESLHVHDGRPGREGARFRYP